MGDRGNVILKYNDGNKIYLYTHWDGSALRQTLREALERGRDRWDDEPYIARIIFSEMIKNDIDGNTGYGISPYMGDGGMDINVDLKAKKVGSLSFEEFVSKSRVKA